MAPFAETITVLYFGIPALDLVVSVGLVYAIYTKRRQYPGTNWFIGSILLGALWSGGLLLHLLATEPERQIAFLQLQAVSSVFAVAAFIVFVSAYTRREFHRHPLVRAGLLSVVVGFPALTATNGYHGLLYAEMVPRTEPFRYVSTSPGPGFIVLVAVLLALVGYSTYALVTHMVSTQRRTGLQLLLLLCGMLAHVCAQVLGNFAPAEGLSHAVYGRLPFMLMVAVGVFRLRLFDVEPVARNRVVERLTDPILVFDRDCRLVDFNETATNLWPTLPHRIDDPGESIADELATVDERAPAVSEERRIIVPVDGEQRHFLLNVTPVERQYSDEIGWYGVLLRDVTGLERSRRRLERQNDHLSRVASTISHDLRNPIQIAYGHTGFLEETIDDLAPTDRVGEPARTHLAEIDASFDRMSTIIDDVLTLTRAGRDVESATEIALSAVARTAWQRVETGGATLEIGRDGTVTADRDGLTSLFEHLFRDVIERSPADSPATVTVVATADGFAVVDDGRNPPPDRDDCGDVFQYAPDAAADGERTGLSLAIVRILADAHEWSVRIDDEFDDGTRFVFRCGPSTDSSRESFGTDRSESRPATVTGRTDEPSRGDSARRDDGSDRKRLPFR